ncbi:MAG: type II toxin-antitoxin system VapC family toxin [Burkholderiaceae bacterium]
MNYIDTSALLKWYLPEAGSDAFTAWISAQHQADTSRLVSVEMHVVLARKQRIGELSNAQATRALAAFLADVDDGLLRVQSIDAAHWEEAERLITVAALPALRTLDALHLAVASVAQVDEFATADRTLAAAARALGMRTPVLH